jgi:hypothetical protein
MAANQRGNHNLQLNYGSDLGHIANADGSPDTPANFGPSTMNASITGSGRRQDVDNVSLFANGEVNTGSTLTFKDQLGAGDRLSASPVPAGQSHGATEAWPRRRGPANGGQHQVSVPYLKNTRAAKARARRLLDQRPAFPPTTPAGAHRTSRTFLIMPALRHDSSVHPYLRLELRVRFGVTGGFANSPTPTPRASASASTVAHAGARWPASSLTTPGSDSPAAWASFA